MDKTCKSSAEHPVAILGVRSGARVRNTWIICLEVRNNSAKAGLMPDVVERLKLGTRKGLALPDESAAYQLVGGVTAHQGKDG